MTCIPPQFERVLNVSDYYRFIIQSQLLIPDFAKPLFSSNSRFGSLLNNIGHDTVNKIRNYPKLPFRYARKKSDAFKAFMLAMLCVQRNKGNQECLVEF